MPAVLGRLGAAGDPMHELSFADFPRTLGTAAGAIGGGALGLLYYLLKRHSDDDTGIGTALASIATGAALGGGAGFAAGHALGVPAAEEIDNIRYERRGPVRQALHAASPLIPTLVGNHELPAEYKDNVIAPVDAGNRVALAGKVTPNQTTVQVMSPKVEQEDKFLREQFINNRPVRVPTLDAIGKAEDASTLSGSETPGSRVGYDYNGALEGAFKTRLPLNTNENGVYVATHAHGTPLAATAGSSLHDVLADLKSKGIINKSTDMLGLQSCNAGGCDIPATVEAATGALPRKLVYTPPGASGGRPFDTLLTSLADRPELREPELLRPKHVVAVHGYDMATAQPTPDPFAARYDVQPIVPTRLTQAASRAAQPVATMLDHYAPGLRAGLDTSPVELGLGDRTEPAAGDASYQQLLDRNRPTAAAVKERYPQFFGNGVYRRY